MLRKGSKQVLWVALAVYTGFTFVGYFTPIRALGAEVVSLSLGPWASFWILFYGLATYGNAGFLREQVCKYMCPYARFQSAMFDQDTLIISYDEQRGEPRGARRRGTAPRAQGLGDCIDCTLCVQVCPTGIDIRKGLQYECIACAACIDACDDVMDKMGSPRGLIRYTTEHAMQGQPRTCCGRAWWCMRRCCCVGAGTLLYSLFTRTPLILDVIRDRNALYREVRGDWIENAYSTQGDQPGRQAAHATVCRWRDEQARNCRARRSRSRSPRERERTIPARLQAPAAVAGGVHLDHAHARRARCPAHRGAREDAFHRTVSHEHASRPLRLVSAVLALVHHRAALERRGRKLISAYLAVHTNDVVSEHARLLRVAAQPWTSRVTRVLFSLRQRLQAGGALSVCSTAIGVRCAAPAARRRRG